MFGFGGGGVGGRMPFYVMLGHRPTNVKNCLFYLLLGKNILSGHSTKATKNYLRYRVAKHQRLQFAKGCNSPKVNIRQRLQFTKELSFFSIDGKGFTDEHFDWISNKWPFITEVTQIGHKIYPLPLCHIKITNAFKSSVAKSGNNPPPRPRAPSYFLISFMNVFEGVT